MTEKDRQNRLNRPITKEEEERFIRVFKIYLENHPELWVDEVADKITDRIMAKTH